MRLLDPAAQTSHFSFLGKECLYRDHRARRVLADAEGKGRFRLEAAPKGTTIEVDGTACAATSGEFQNSIVVTSLEEGEASIRISIGAQFEFSKADLRTGSFFEGSGWIVGGTAGVMVDSSHEWSPEPVAGFAVPFFEGFVGQAEVQFLTAQREKVRIIDQFRISDLNALREREWAVQNMSRLFELTSEFADGDPFEGVHASHLNAASWNMTIPKEAIGLILRKLYDRFHGRQRARVLLDGRAVGTWYCPLQDRTRRWAWSRFGFALDRVADSPTVRLTVDPPAGAPLWDVSEIQVLAILRDWSVCLDDAFR